MRRLVCWYMLLTVGVGCGPDEKEKTDEPLVIISEVSCFDACLNWQVVTEDCSPFGNGYSEADLRPVCQAQCDDDVETWQGFYNAGNACLGARGMCDEFWVCNGACNEPTQTTEQSYGDCMSAQGYEPYPNDSPCEGGQREAEVNGELGCFDECVGGVCGDGHTCRSGLCIPDRQ